MKIENCKLDTSLRYYLKVYGCQHNEWDGARIDHMLQKLGLIPSSEQEADIICIVSCSVRQTAVDRIMGRIKNWKGKSIIITGCVLDLDKKKYESKGVKIWDFNKPEELFALIPKQQPDKKTVEQLLNEGNSASKYLPIMIGCNNFCAYCAVPYTRGREKSRKIEEIVIDFKKLVARGAKEIILLGQNVNSFKAEQIENDMIFLHKDSKYKNAFARLLEILNNIDGEFIFSFTSNHPKDMHDDVIDAIATLSKVQKRIHLPLQSGSDKILKAMNRPYTKDQYLKLIKKIKGRIPNIQITTDAIVGFPGETEEDFQETVDVYEEVAYFQSFTNKYSPRLGTAAYSLGDPISWEEKQRRWKILNSIANKNFIRK